METKNLNYKELVESITQNLKNKGNKPVEESSDSTNNELSKRRYINFEPIPDFMKEEPAKRGNINFEPPPVDQSIEGRLERLENNQLQIIKMLNQIFGNKARLLR